MMRLTALSPEPNKVVLLGDSGQQIAEIDGEAAVKFGHDLIHAGEKALRDGGLIHEESS